RRQQVGVAPDGLGTGLDRGAGHMGGGRLIVVRHLEGTKAPVADMERLSRILAPAFTAAKPFDESHTSSLSTRALAPGHPASTASWLVVAASLGPIPRPLWISGPNGD